MNNTQSYINFVEGTLKNTDEAQFVSNFATDTDFRRGFQSYLKVTSAINNNIKSFGPSLEETNFIFSSLGLALPISQTIKPKNVSDSFIHSKLFSSLLSSVISVVITAFLLTSFLLNSLKTPNNINSSKNISEIPKVISSEQVPANKENVINNKHRSNNIITKNDTNSTNLSLIESAKQQNNYLIMESSNISKSNLNNLDNDDGNNKLSLINISNLNNPQQYAINSVHKWDLGLELEVKGSVNWNYPKETISPKAFNKFNNYGLALFYKINEKFKIGAEVKQETFYLAFSNTINIDTLISYKEQPNYTTVSTDIRYIPIKIYDFNAITQLGLGINRGGYVIKPSLGIELNEYSDISFIILVEYDKFLYHQGNNWFSTSKLGLNLGMSYKF